MIQASDMAQRMMSVIETYHETDHVDAKQPSSLKDLDGLIAAKGWVDVVQWHLEDAIRAPELAGDAVIALKRRIDACNQQRTDAVEAIDALLQSTLQPIESTAWDISTRTETLGWALDRLCILQLKRYHMTIEVKRGSVDQSLLDALNAQYHELIAAMDQLIEDLATGKVSYTLYKQYKLYNDPSTNPSLYG